MGVKSFPDGGAGLSGVLSFGDSCMEGWVLEVKEDCGDGGDCTEGEDLNDEPEGDGMF